VREKKAARSPTRETYSPVHYANFIGGFVGGNEIVDDPKSCIVLTTDSVYYNYYGDSVLVRKRFTVSWDKDLFGKSFARIVLLADRNTVITWGNDTLSVGMAIRKAAEPGNAGFYARCSRSL
jgi:hypothetical protein